MDNKKTKLFNFLRIRASNGVMQNHFIATSKEEIQPVMDYIRSFDQKSQSMLIKQHNLTILKEYQKIMEKIGESLNFDDLKI